MVKDEQTNSVTRSVRRMTALAFALMGQIVAVIGLAVGLLFPELFKPLLGEDARTADTVIFSLLIGVLISGLGLAKWFGDVKSDIDGIEKNLREANDGSVIWGQLLHSPVAEPTVDAVRAVTDIDFGVWTRRAAWAGMATEELTRCANDLRRRADEVQRGVIRVEKEDWNYLVALVGDWTGVMRATSVQSVDGKDFWRACGERDTYLLAQYDALKDRNLRSIQRAYIVTSDMKQLLQTETPDRRAFLETTLLNELIGVDVRFVEADDIDDYILFQPGPRKPKTQTDSLLYAFARGGKDGTTIISCDAAEVRARSEEYAEVWARGERPENFYRSHGLTNIIAEIRATDPLQKLRSGRE